MENVRARAERTVVQPGDIFFTQGRGLVSWGIRYFTQVAGESRTHVTHTGIFLESGRLTTALACEALGRGVVIQNPYRARETKRERIAVFRAAGLSWEQRELIAEKAREYEGRRYGYVKIAAHWIDWILGGMYVARRLTGMDRYPICSWLAAHSLDVVNLRPGGDPRSTSPDDLWDGILRDSGWFTVFPLLEIEGPDANELAPDPSPA